MRRSEVAVLALSVAALLVAVGLPGLRFMGDNRPAPPPGQPCPSSFGGTLTVENGTPVLGGVFAQGSIQAFGSNGSSVILGGLASFERGRQPYDSAPASALLRPGPPSPGTTDLTAAIAPYFIGGGVFPVGWNGSAWLLAGQTTWGDLAVGALVEYRGGQVVNLTGLIAPYFRGTVPSQDIGIFIAGWDGTGWLIGGNTSQGASLVYLQGDRVTDLTPEIPNNHPGAWVQMLGWNGSSWLVGGRGVLFGWTGGHVTDLWEGSPFAPDGGVFGMDWDGTRWLVGGAPAVLVYVQGAELRSGPALPSGFNAWVNAVVHVPGGWVLAGGAYEGSAHAPAMAYASDAVAPAPAQDLTACLPGTFLGGWVQFGAFAPAWPGTVVLVGEGGTDPVTGTSHGAMALLHLGTV